MIPLCTNQIQSKWHRFRLINFFSNNKISRLLSLIGRSKFVEDLVQIKKKLFKKLMVQRNENDALKYTHTHTHTYTHSCKRPNEIKSQAVYTKYDQ